MPAQVWAWRRSVPVSTASKVMPRSRQYSPRRTLWLLAEFAELVVVGRAKRGLAVAHEVEGSHAGDCRKFCAWRLSPARRMLSNQEQISISPFGVCRRARRSGRAGLHRHARQVEGLAGPGQGVGLRVLQFERRQPHTAGRHGRRRVHRAPLDQRGQVP